MTGALRTGVPDADHACVNAVTRILDELLPAAVARGASDVHLKVPSPPLLRVHGALVRMDELGEVTPAMAEDCLAAMLARLPHSAKALEFERRGEVDFAFGHPGVGRFRVNAYRQRGSITLVLRPVPFAVPRLDDLGPAGGPRRPGGRPGRAGDRLRPRRLRRDHDRRRPG